MSKLNKKEKLVCNLIDGFLFREDIENSYELAFNKMMEVAEIELNTYNTNDVSNIIGQYVY